MVDITSLSCPHSSLGDAIRAPRLPEGWRDIPGRYWCHLGKVDFSCGPAKAVIPAKAEIYSANLWRCAVVALDSRFRGNDRRLEWIPIPNDTSTPQPCVPIP